MSVKKTLCGTGRYLSGAGIGALLLACAGNTAMRGTGTLPALASTTSATLPAAASGDAPVADDYYVLGRSRFAAGRAVEALAAYRRALALDPGHAGTRNGLAVLYAGEGDYAGAIAVWSEMTRKAPAAPASAYLFVNLGYAYLLAGDTGHALAALRQACLLDPVDATAWEHLGAALQHAGQTDRAAQALKQAGSLRQHEGRADDALLGRGVMAATATASAKETAHTAPPLVPVPAPLPVAAPAASPPLPRLEISNGNGVPGMAAALAQTLREGGDRSWGALRLTNERHFGMAYSRIEYKPQQEAAARRLARDMGALTRVKVCRCGRADVRLVLGHDLGNLAALRRFYLRQLAQAREVLAALQATPPAPDV